LITIIHYTIVWSIILLNFIFYYKTKRLLIQEIGDDEELINRYTSRLRWFPIIQALAMFPSAFNKCVYYILGKHYFIIFIVRSISDGLAGCIFSILYISHPAVIGSIFNCLKRRGRVDKTTINSQYENSFISEKSDFSSDKF
jgi:hypothetical protein